MAELCRVYLDTCCFIDLIKTELGKTLDADKRDDVWFLQKLMEANRDGEVALFTSTLTIAECRHGGDGDINELIKANFSKLLMSGQYVKLVQMTPFIAQDARDLTWEKGIHLKGADSIHVASAIDRKCEELLTSNGRMVRLGAAEAPLQKLGLRVCAPRFTDCLPSKYRQMDFEKLDA